MMTLNKSHVKDGEMLLTDLNTPTTISILRCSSKVGRLARASSSSLLVLKSL